MLCDEHRMSFHRCLFSIIFRESRRQPGCDEIEGMGSDCVDAFILDVLAVLIRQFESGSEFGFLQGGEDDRGHFLVH